MGTEAQGKEDAEKSTITTESTVSALEVLLDWRRTPGNQRTAKWWHEWLDKMDEAIANEQK